MEVESSDSAVLVSVLIILGSIGGSPASHVNLCFAPWWRRVLLEPSSSG